VVIGTNDMPNAALTMHEVTKVVRKANGDAIRVLDRLSLTIAEGELVSLLGPNGCGKTTLLRLIAGLDQPTSGELMLDGEPILGPGAERGLMFQDPSLFPWLTVRRNVQAGLVARSMLKQGRGEADDLMRLVGLEAFADAYPHQLSGGMAQRAALARALVNRPRVLLLDEPLAALDQFTRLRMQDEILRLWQMRGATMLMVSHDIDEAIAMSDRIVILSARPGRVEHVLKVELPRPRVRTSAEFLTLRSRILDMLHLSGVSDAT
jgi:NitT/TauT family transport system ATP-binding protein/sulfonate transport system ATP-binding protein